MKANKDHSKTDISHNHTFAMNTRFDFIIWPKPDDIDLLFRDIKECLQKWELTLSRYNPDSEVYKINNQSLQNSVVSNHLWELLNDCKVYSQQTLGYFDICYIAKGESDDKIVLNPKTQTVHFNNNDCIVDFGAVGKGVALQHINKLLDKYDIENAFISFGDSSVLTRGSHPHGAFWPFSLQEKYGITEQFKLNNHCISASGLQNGKAHIYDPHNTHLIDTHNIVCVQGENPVEAEVLSTALYAAPEEYQEQIIGNFSVHKVVYI